jgi:hypothetical protein
VFIPSLFLTSPYHRHPHQTTHTKPTPKQNSYFSNVTAGHEWGKHPWPAFFLRAPSLPAYEKTVPEPRMLSDVSGDSEEAVLPTMEKLIAAIVQNRTAGGACVRMCAGIVVR